MPTKFDVGLRYTDGTRSGNSGLMKILERENGKRYEALRRSLVEIEPDSDPASLRTKIPGILAAQP